MFNCAESTAKIKWLNESVHYVLFYLLLHHGTVVAINVNWVHEFQGWTFQPCHFLLFSTFFSVTQYLIHLNLWLDLLELVVKRDYYLPSVMSYISRVFVYFSYFGVKKVNSHPWTQVNSAFGLGQRYLEST